MNTEFIFVGTELLLGNILNTNAKYLSEKCAELGISLYYQTVVGDNAGRLQSVLKTALDRSDCVILTGGLGPTGDDITKEVAAKVMGLSLVEDSISKDMLEEFFARIRRPVSGNNYKQSMVPEGCTVLYNKNGTAPGILIEEGGKTVILLPGPPCEMQPMFEEYCVPYFLSRSDLVISSIMIKMIGIGESDAAARISDIIDKCINPTVAPYAKVNQVHLRVTARAKSKEECHELIEPVFEEIKERLGEYIYTTDAEVEIEDVVVSLLKKKGLAISVCESLTGGLLSGKIVNVSGASDVLSESYITYSNDAKMRVLNVPEEILAVHGAVSKECAAAMAKGCAAVSGSDIAISTTGVAGPDGGSADKPVGTVYIGIFYKGEVTVRRLMLFGSRQNIRESACIRALFMAAKLIDDIPLPF